MDTIILVPVQSYPLVEEQGLCIDQRRYGPTKSSSKVVREPPMDGFIQTYDVPAVFDGLLWNFGQRKLIARGYILFKERTLYDHRKKSWSQIESCVSKRSPFRNVSTARDHR